LNDKGACKKFRSSVFKLQPGYRLFGEVPIFDLACWLLCLVGLF